MAWFKKKADPLLERERALDNEIAALEATIKRLSAQPQQDHARPHLRSTALPHGGVLNHEPVTAPSPRPAAPSEPVFEDVDQARLMSQAGPPPREELYNQELGFRKYDLLALVQRIREQFRGPSATNPKLVSYLAAGSFQGLQPLRREKRVARNRLLALVTILFLVLLGIVLVFLRGH